MKEVNLNGLMSWLKNSKGALNPRIVIPKIQRDYAEGRETESVKKKRSRLLMDMLDVVYGIQQKLSLDFVYGTTDQEGFKPLDGQQRLTTLFLLYWLFGRNTDITDSAKHSVFVYETRKTSEDFLHWLIKQDSKPIIDAWLNSVECARTINKENEEKWTTETNNKGVVDKIANRLAFPLVKVPSLFDHFLGMDAFKWEWHVDPNIHSMIVVLDAACSIIGSLGRDLQTGIDNNKNLDQITFELLPDLVCDGDELFEKMNARGKELTSFDLLKSSLEEEAEAQKSKISNNWRKAIDNEWIDYCWDNSSIPSNPKLEDVKEVERKLERLLIRMVGKSFFKTDINYTLPTNTNEEILGQILKVSIFKDCDKAVDNYFKYARYERACKNTKLSALNFEEVFEDVNCMLFTEDFGNNNRKFVWRDISWYLHRNGLKMHPDNDATLLEDFTADSLNHDIRVVFYGMVAYLRRVDAKSIAGDSKTGKQPNAIEFSNFKDWMRFARNVFMAANKNVRIDTPELVIKAIEAIDVWLEEYFKNYHKGLAENEMLNFIADFVVLNRQGQEQERLNEEALKANLRLGSEKVNSGTVTDWEAAIVDAEENPYLWGQIKAPLSWATAAIIQYDLNKFVNYKMKLKELFEMPYNVIDISLLQACVSIQSYRFNGKGSLTWGSLGLLTDDRDISWKRHLRDNNSGTYGFLIKELVDQWMMPKYATLSRVDFLKQFRLVNLKSIMKTDWRYYICNLTEQQLADVFNLVGTSYRYINEDSGSVYLYRAQTQRSDAIRYELVTAYLYVRINVPVKRIEPFKNAGGSYVEFEYNGNIIRVTSIPGGLYNIAQNGATVASGVDIPGLEKELINIGIITSL